MTKPSQHNAKWCPWLICQHICQHRSLQFLGTRLHGVHLWCFNRYSTSIGAAIGLFVCFIPLPMQWSCVVFWRSFKLICRPLLLSCFTAGLISACIAFLLIQATWRSIAHYFPSDEEQSQAHAQQD